MEQLHPVWMEFNETEHWTLLLEFINKIWLTYSYDIVDGCRFQDEKMEALISSAATHLIL